MLLAHVRFADMIISGVVVDVKNILTAINLEIKYETPKEILVDCPFCGDGSANLSVNRDSGLYHCWRCGAEDRRAKGNLVHLVAIIRGIGHVDASEYILQYGTFATQDQLLKRVREVFARKKNMRIKTVSVQEEVDRYYNPRHPFWKKRGIRRYTAERFQLGYDQKRNHAIIPIFDGETPIAIVRRNDSGFGPKYLFPEGFKKERYLYGLSHSKGGGLCIVEGPIDALKVHQAGYNAVAVMGDSFSVYQSQLIMDYGPEYVVLMTDEDLGGEILSTKVWDTYPLRNIYYAEMPKNKNDPGECNSDEIWESIVTKRHVLSLYLRGFTRESHSSSLI